MKKGTEHRSGFRVKPKDNVVGYMKTGEAAKKWLEKHGDGTPRSRKNRMARARLRRLDLDELRDMGDSV